MHKYFNDVSQWFTEFQIEVIQNIINEEIEKFKKHELPNLIQQELKKQVK